MGHRKSSSVSVSGQKLSREDLQGAESGAGREEAATQGQGVSSSGSGAGGSGGGSYVDAPQPLDAERAALLRSKQAELDAIEDRHDDLVRFSLLRRARTLSEGVMAPHSRVWAHLNTVHVATRGVSSRTLDDFGYV
jgi:hypothetical protein